MSSTERGGAIEAEMVLDRWRSTAIGALRREGSTTINQYWILLMLDRPDPVPLSAVVETLELNYTTVAEGVARMAADGTVAKAESEDDRRATMVALTPEGRALLGRLDHALVQVAKRALAPLSGQLRIQAMALLYSACVRLNKNRTVGHLARGDSAFLIICQQVASNFATICKQNLVTAQQGHLLLAAASSDEPISAKEARRLLAFDAPTLSRTMARSESAGLVTRATGATKRERQITVTSLGLQCASLIAEGTEEMLRQLFGDDYGTETYRQTIAALGRSLRDDLPARQQ